MARKLKERKIPELRKWLIPILRKASLRWPGKNVARDKARMEIQIGTFRNGKPLMKVMYKCAECVNEGREIYYHEKHLTQMDHHIPAMNLDGFISWDVYLPSLFCQPDNYKCLCLDHHSKKTVRENIIRRAKRMEKAKLANAAKKTKKSVKKKSNKKR